MKKDVVLNEIMKLNWKERIIVKIFAKTIIKMYNIQRIKLINSILK